MDYRDFRTGAYVTIGLHDFRITEYGTLEYIPFTDDVWEYVL